jgi:hypothetical protein
MKKITLLLLFVSTHVYAWSFLGPKDYSECIANNLNNITNSMSEKLIMMACDNKFNQGDPTKDIDDCLLKNAKNGASSKAAMDIYVSCIDESDAKK